SIPVSALDPIFYTHHTNIDRLYECWLHVNESARLPTNSTQLNTNFTFVDSDGSTPTRRVGDMLTTAQLGYKYASGGGCPPASQAMVLAQNTTGGEHAEMTPMAEHVLGSVGPTRLDPAATTVPLAISPPAPQA